MPAGETLPSAYEEIEYVEQQLLERQSSSDSKRAHSPSLPVAAPLEQHPAAALTGGGGGDSGFGGPRSSQWPHSLRGLSASLKSATAEFISGLGFAPLTVYPLLDTPPPPKPRWKKRNRFGVAPWTSLLPDPIDDQAQPLGVQV